MFNDLKVIEEIECSDVSALFEHLSVHKDIWNRHEKNNWIFRGQADSNWRLVPKAFREGVMLDYLDSNATGPRSDYSQQTFFEKLLLDKFLKEADEVGLHIPHVNPGYLDDVNLFNFNKSAIINTPWPTKADSPCLALAQHHGVPTRLLDFTYDPYVALFFGAIDAYKVNRMSSSNPNSNYFSLWAIDTDYLSLAAFSKIPLIIEPITVPHDSNHFLHAQKGVFLVDRLIHLNWNNHPDISRSIDGIINNRTSDLLLKLKEAEHPFLVCEFYEEIIKDMPALIKYIIPVNLSLDIIKLLEKRHYCLASLMPDYKHVSLWLDFKRDNFYKKQ